MKIVSLPYTRSISCSADAVDIRWFILFSLLLITQLRPTALANISPHIFWYLHFWKLYVLFDVDSIFFCTDLIQRPFLMQGSSWDSSICKYTYKFFNTYSWTLQIAPVFLISWNTPVIVQGLLVGVRVDQGAETNVGRLKWTTYVPYW